MEKIVYKYINYKSEEFKQVINLRYNILFQPYNKIEKYEYDELDDKSLHLVALDKNKVVGYSRLTYVNGIGTISNVLVVPECSSMGIGINMMKKQISKARDFNVSKLSLNARIDTIDFYKKAGFQRQNIINISEKTGLPLESMVIKIGRRDKLYK